MEEVEGPGNASRHVPHNPFAAGDLRGESFTRDERVRSGEPLTQDEIRKIEAANTAKRERYVKAIIAEDSLILDKDRMTLFSRSESGITNSYGSYREDGERLHINGVPKMYSSVRLHGGRTFFLHELDTDSYIALISEPPGVRSAPSKQYSTEQLEALVEKHFDAAASSSEKLSRIEAELPSLSNQQLMNRYAELVKGGARLISFGELLVDSMMSSLFGGLRGLGPSADERLKSAELTLTVGALAGRYGDIVSRASDETLRAVLIELTEGGLESKRESNKGSFFLRYISGPLALWVIKNTKPQQVKSLWVKMEEKALSSTNPQLSKVALIEKILEKDPTL